jgi:hypothetical protein
MGPRVSLSRARDILQSLTLCSPKSSGHSTEARWTEVAHYQAHDPRACFSLSWTESTSTDEQDLGRLASTGGDGRILVWKVVRVRFLMQRAIQLADLSAPPSLACTRQRPMKQCSHLTYRVRYQRWK